MAGDRQVVIVFDVAEDCPMDEDELWAVVEHAVGEWWAVPDALTLNEIKVVET